MFAGMSREMTFTTQGSVFLSRRLGSVNVKNLYLGER